MWDPVSGSVTLGCSPITICHLEGPLLLERTERKLRFNVLEI